MLRRYSCDDDGVGRFTNQEARFISSEGEIQSFQFLLPLASRGPKVVWSFQLLVPVGLPRTQAFQRLVLLELAMIQSLQLLVPLGLTVNKSSVTFGLVSH